ncbi:MAG: beta-galactosidase, partial [Prevotellaceae bacterium]|nr:beta-galactosidase [Prevotellaceae bacterium]
MKNKLSLLVVCISFASLATAQRKVITLSEGWGISPITTVKNITPEKVSIPHTWNANYPQGSTLYNREMMIYWRDLEVTADMQGKRLFLFFEGINSAADVFVNKKTVGTHLGGYTACSFEITDYVKPGKNQLEVWVSNAYRTDVLPISGDFNVYGGLHRPCHLIVTEQSCISPTFYASPGVFIHQKNISEKSANIVVETLLSLKEVKSGLTLKTTVSDKNSRVVASTETAVTAENVKQPLQIATPTLWNGKKNPYLYSVAVELYEGGILKDKVVQRTGFRYFSVDADKGFFLNGKYLDLYGFCRHEDVKGKGSALTPEDYETDMSLILESGATAMRLAHYPHAEPMYKLSDENGIVLWTEIPFVGPGGYAHTGYVKSVESNARLSLKELVYQKYNHPSVIFWGVFNEILVTDSSARLFIGYDDPIPFIKELNAMYKSLDSSRLTAIATCVEQSHYLGTSDLLAWNKYFGWYSDAAPEAGKFFDEARRTSGGQAVGVSEYGGGASVQQHQWPLDASNKADSRFHPEEAQNYCHEGNWEAFAQRPYLWAKFIWLFADFQSYLRNEG